MTNEIVERYRNILEGFIEDIIDELRAEIEGEVRREVLAALQHVRGASTAPAKRGRRSSKGRRTSKASGKITLHEAILQVMRARKEPVRAGDLLEAVIVAGYRTKSTPEILRTAIYARLANMEEVERAGRGLYSLKKSVKS